LKKTNIIPYLHAVNVLFLLSMLWMILVTAGPLPQKIPIHFAMDGTPDGFGNKNSLSMLVVVAVAVSVLLYSVVALLPWLKRKKKFITFPDREKFLALPEETQQQYWDLIKEFLLAVTASMNFIWASALYGTIQVAARKVDKLPNWAILPGLAIILFLNIVYIRRMTRLPAKLIKQSQQ